MCHHIILNTKNNAGVIEDMGVPDNQEFPCSGRMLAKFDHSVGWLVQLCWRDLLHSPVVYNDTSSS